MSRQRLSIEQEASVVSVFKSLSACVLKQIPSWDFATGKHQFLTFQAKFVSMLNSVGNLRFAIELSQKNDVGRPDLTAPLILNANSSQLNLIRVGREIRILGTQKLGAIGGNALTLPNVGQVSKGKVILLREGGPFVTIFANERLIGQYDLTQPDVEPPMPSGFRRKAADYQHAIIDHYAQRVRNLSTNHWKDRKKRTLSPKLGAYTTEAIFHFDLHSWLHLFLDAQVTSNPKLLNKDEFDIFIHAPNGRTYMVEVKWLGTNGPTTYRIKDFSRGVKQLNKYLKDHKDVFEATLVGYDGRDEMQFKYIHCIDNDRREGCKRIRKCCGIEVGVRGHCLVLFLESRTASEQ